MSLFNPWPIVRADLRRHRALALATIALVALSVATGIAVISQERALRQGSARAADDFDLLIGAPGSPTQLVLSTVYLRTEAIPLTDGAVLARASVAPGVKVAAPIAFGDHWQGYPIIGTIAAFASRDGALPPSEGRLFARRGEAVVGADVALPLGARLHPQHGHAEADAAHHDDGDDDDDDNKGDERHTHQEYTVVGRLPARHTIWDRAILVPVEDVWAVHGLPTGHADESPERLGPPWTAAALPGVPAIAVRPDSVTAAYFLRNQFRTATSVALFPAEVLNALYGVLGNVRDLMSLLALSTQILVVGAVLLALLVGFLARQRQFAVLRAIGASRAYVFCVVWSEVTLLIGSGAVLGTGLGVGAAIALSAWLETRLGFFMPVSFGQEEALLVGGLIAAGALIAVLPAWRVFRRPLAEALNAA